MCPLSLPLLWFGLSIFNKLYIYKGTTVVKIKTLPSKTMSHSSSVVQEKIKEYEAAAAVEEEKQLTLDKEIQLCQLQLQLRSTTAPEKERLGSTTRPSPPKGYVSLVDIVKEMGIPIDENGPEFRDLANYIHRRYCETYLQGSPS